MPLSGEEHARNVCELSLYRERMKHDPGAFHLWVDTPEIQQRRRDQARHPSKRKPFPGFEE